MQFLLAAGLSYEKSSRATNMTYTSMLYALFFDKVVFGQTPGFMSIIGSTLILGSAVYMAVRKEGSAAPKGDEGEVRSEDGADEEEGVGLMGAVDGVGSSGSSDQDVEMREMR